MTYVIAEPCIGTKDNSCVEVCPVDCIHPTPDEPDYDDVPMLYIDPEECIDCDACVEACPVDACFAEDQLPEEWAKYTENNAKYYAGNGNQGGRSGAGPRPTATKRPPASERRRVRGPASPATRSAKTRPGRSPLDGWPGRPDRRGRPGPEGFRRRPARAAAS